MLANLHISVGAAGGGLGKNTINIRHEMRREGRGIDEKLLDAIASV